MFTRPTLLLNTCGGRSMSEDYRDKLAQFFLASHSPAASHFSQLFANSARDCTAAKRTGRCLCIPERTVGPFQCGYKLFSNNLPSLYPGQNQQHGTALKTPFCGSRQTARSRGFAPSCTHQNSPSGRMSQEANRHHSNTLSGSPSARGAKQGVNA